MKPSIELIHFQPGCPYIIKMNKAHNHIHMHAGLEIIWVLSGKINVTVSQLDYHLQPNDILLINHFESHRVVPVNKNYQILHFYIDSLFFSSQNQQFYDLHFDVKSFQNSKENQQPYDVIRTLLSHFYGKQDQKIDLQADFFRLIQYIVDRFSKRRPLIHKAEKLNADWPVIQQVLNTIERNFKGKLMLNEISKKLHYNSSYLSDLFRKNIGITFKSYLDEIRLRYSLFLLLHNDMSITEIALSSGFSDDKSYYKVFRNTWSVTPFQLRKQYKNISVWDIQNTDANDNFPTINLIRYYRNLPIEHSVIEQKTSELFISIDVQKEGHPIKRVWNKMVNIGSASSLLVQNVQDQLREIQTDIKFEYVRFEGIFNQEMEVLQFGENGYKYNWKFVNNILDYLLNIDAKPFISLSYMPQLLASSNTYLFNYRSNTSPPIDMSQWLSLVQSFLMNCINHYGHKEVSQWYFQVWTEFPVNGIHWSGTFQQYLEFYKQTVLLIKGLSPNFKVGPASENFYTSGDKLSKQLLEYCKKQHVPIDFYACNIYHNRILNLENLNSNFVDYKGTIFRYESQNYTKRRLYQCHKLIRMYNNEETEFIITRWNFSWDVQNYLHDTAFMVAFIMNNMLHPTSSLAKAIGYLSASDILYEWSINNYPFYGGSGLVNTEGIKKAAYYAFVFLNKLGNTVIEEGPNYIVTKQGEDIQILIYNHAYPNQMYCQGGDQLKDTLQRYDCFEENNSLLVNIFLSNMYGTYKCKMYSLNREHGSAFDDWVRMGGLLDMNHEEIAYLKRKSYPNLIMKQVTCKGSYQMSVQIPVHGVECVTFHKVLY